MTQKYLSYFLLLGIFFPLCRVNSTVLSDIIITEIGATESAGFEWVEIYNRGTVDVDITGYKFWEGGTNHSLTVKQGSIVLKTGEFALIVQDDVKFTQKYPNVTSTLLDSSWGSLNEGGEDIGLKDASGNFLQQFVYEAVTQFSLERIDVVSNDLSESNWKEHPSGNSVGAVNSVLRVFVPPVETPPLETTPTLPEEIESVESIPPVLPTSSDQNMLEETIPTLEAENIPLPVVPVEDNPTPLSIGDILINEFFPQPNDGEKEWIELYNNSLFSVDISGWTVEDGSGKIASPSSTMNAYEFLVIELPSSKLNNDGDVIFLKNTAGEIIDEVHYGDGEERSEPTPPKKGNTLARLSESVNTNNHWVYFRETTTPTKGSLNSIVAPQILVETTHSPSGSIHATNVSTPPTNSGEKIPPGVLVINEVYPNPTGTDTEDEFIELFNTSNNSIDLTGATLMDAGGTGFKLTQKIEAQGFLTLYRKTTHISLNNTGTEVVKVMGSNSEAVAEFTYEGSREGESINRLENGETKWSVMRTPNAKNIVQEKKILDEVETIPKKNNKEVVSVKNEKEVMKWDQEVGQYFQISEIFPAPGKGEEEFIEIYNGASSTLDISFFQIDDEEGGSRPYIFPQGTKIESMKFLVIPKKMSRISLNNTEDIARILFPDGKILEEIPYDEVEIGFSYALSSTSSLQGDEWEWTSEVTPGLENTIVFVEEEIKSKKTKGNLVVTSIDKIFDLEKGDTVQVKGTVVVPPNTFSSQYFYLADTQGVQVYMSKRDFPSLSVGDVLQVTGELSEAQGQLRIKVTDKQDMVKIGKNEVKREETSISEIDDSQQGMIVTIAGEITEKKSTYLYIDDGVTEIEVALKKNTGIKIPDISLGDTVSVTGIVLPAKSGYQIVPRFPEDVMKTISASTTIPLMEEKAETKNEKKVLVATTGGIGSLILGFLAKVHGSKVWSFTKRVSGVAVAVIRKKKDLG